MAQEVPAFSLRDAFQKLCFPLVIIRSRLNSPIRRFSNDAQALAGKEIRVIFDLIDSGMNSGFVEPGNTAVREARAFRCAEPGRSGTTRQGRGYGDGC